MKTKYPLSLLVLIAALSGFISFVSVQALQDNQHHPQLLNDVTRDATAPDREGPLGGFANIVQQASPAVVSITSSSYVPIGRNRRGEIVAQEVPGGLGSGVIITEDGTILTNVHVISSGGRLVDQVFVTLSDGRELKAEVIGVDPESDIAVLDVQGENLPTAILGDSDQLLPGDTVLAIGSPFGLDATVTSGIVSAIGRSALGINRDEDFIQTDASINPGNSGGALIDNRGRVGINTAIFSETGNSIGIGFAIPISKALNIANQLVTTGQVSRGFLGIRPATMTPQVAQAASQDGVQLPSSGILVYEITPNGPASRGGLQRFDVITHIDGEPVQELNDFLRRIADTPPGQTVQLQIVRDGQALQITSPVGQRPN